MAENQQNTERAFNPPPKIDFDLPKINRHDTPVSPFSKKMAIFLAVVAGIVGAQDFYLGKKKTGIIKVVLFCFGLGAINAVWALVDIIYMLAKKNYCDGLNRPLQ